MQLASHELYDLNELTLSCVNSITSMAYFINKAKDPELKALIQKHFPYHVKDYNTKVEYMSRQSGAKTGLPVPEMTHILNNYLETSVNAQAVTPRTDVADFNDREIATAYLLTLKRAGREYAWSAMEAGNPELRCFLESAFQMSSHHAYDVWQWMVKKGYYPVEAAQPDAAGLLGSMYHVVDHHTAAFQ